MRTSTTTPNNNEESMIADLSKYMLLNVHDHKVELREKIVSEINSALETIKNDIPEERWTEGCKNVILEQLYAIAMPASCKPNHEIRFCVDRACDAAGDDGIPLHDRGYFDLTWADQLEMYVDYVKGRCVLDYLREKNVQRLQRMRDELRELGYDLVAFPVEDEDLGETLRMKRERYYDC